MRARGEEKDRVVHGHHGREGPDSQGRGMWRQQETGRWGHLLWKTLLQVVHDTLVWGKQLDFSVKIINSIRKVYIDAFSKSAPRPAVSVWEWETWSATREERSFVGATLSPSRFTSRRAHSSLAPPNLQVGLSKLNIKAVQQDMYYCKYVL